MSKRRRIDRLLVERGLFDSRAKAQAAIKAGLVSTGDVVVRKSSDEVAIDAPLAATPAHPYVSRGGLKLVTALDQFAFDPRGRACLDVGASTGGFTQVLLERGARLVIAVDVGRDQLHASLCGRPDIVSLEQTDIRTLAATAFPEVPDLVTVDVSFISLKLVLPAVTTLAPKAQLVALIKPQFEAGPERVTKGIVRDPAVHAEVRESIQIHAASLGWRVLGVIPSPIEGGDGNREFLLGAERARYHSNRCKP